MDSGWPLHSSACTESAAKSQHQTAMPRKTRPKWCARKSRAYIAIMGCPVFVSLPHAHIDTLDVAYDWLYISFQAPQTFISGGLKPKSPSSVFLLKILTENRLHHHFTICNAIIMSPLSLRFMLWEKPHLSPPNPTRSTTYCRASSVLLLQPINSLLFQLQDLSFPIYHIGGLER